MGTLGENSSSNTTNSFNNINLCSCTGKRKFDMVNGSNSGDYGFISLGQFIDKGINNGLKLGSVDLH